MLNRKFDASKSPTFHILTVSSKPAFKSLNMKTYFKNNWKGLLWDIILMFFIIISTQYLVTKDTDLSLLGSQPVANLLKMVGLAIVGGAGAHHSTKWILKRFSKKS